MILSPSLLFSYSGVSNSATPRTAEHQASLSFTISQSLLKLMSIESVIPSNHLLCHSLLLLPSIFPSIRVFPNEKRDSADMIKFKDLAFRNYPGLSRWV